MLIYSDYIDTQKKMISACISEIESKLLWQLSEIKKIESEEMTENRFKAIQARKKDIEKWFELLTLIKDLETIERKKNTEVENEIKFLQTALQQNYEENKFWVQKAKEFLNGKN